MNEKKEKKIKEKENAGGRQQQLFMILCSKQEHKRRRERQHMSIRTLDIQDTTVIEWWCASTQDPCYLWIGWVYGSKKLPEMPCANPIRIGKALYIN